MIKVLEKKRIDNADFFTYLISAFADTKEEVVPGATFIDMPTDGDMEPGSTVHTGDGNVAFLLSDGTWSWV